MIAITRSYINSNINSYALIVLRNKDTTSGILKYFDEQKLELILESGKIVEYNNLQSIAFLQIH